MKVPIPFKKLLPFKLKPLSGFLIVRFQDNNLTNPQPHWYIIIRIINTDNFIVIIITSQKNNRIRYYNRTNQPKASECLVGVNNNDFSYLTQDSAVNCNVAEHLSIEEIVHRVDEKQGFKIEEEPIQPYLRKEIVSAILKSPLLGRAIKDLAKASNPL
ncbi:MAG: hypothetical protein V2A69_15665 [Pseudomonadota bacterium]